MLVWFIVLISILTIWGIKIWVEPDLQAQEEKNLTFAVQDIGTEIKLTLAAVKAQQRERNQLVPRLKNTEIDCLLPFMVEQYGSELVFGDGILPQPNKRVDGTLRTSTFYHRDSSGKLVINMYWNSDEAPDYYTQAWHKAGKNAAKGECVWLNLAESSNKLAKIIHQ